MSLATKKLSRLLRTSETVLMQFEEVMAHITGKTSVLNEIAEQNEMRVDNAVKLLGYKLDASAEEVYGGLMRKIEENDETLVKYLGNPVSTTVEGCETIADAARQITGTPTGYFLRRDIAERLFRKNPPQNLMKELKVSTVDDLLKRYPLNTLFPGVRFAEESAWLNDVFFRPFAMLTPEDFEERPVDLVVLPQEFREIGQKFAGHKLHHISHLKELGVIFVMPTLGEDHETPTGATLEILTLVLHYLHEVPFYSRVFKRFANNSATFAANLIGALRGNVLPYAPDGQIEHGKFLIVQRYLAKDDASDPRLFMPHMNPEATHWRLVEEKLEEFAKKHTELKLEFWRGLGAVGEFFPLNVQSEIYLGRGVSEAALLSFDLIDNLISHNRKSPVLEKYLYHQQEALWNEIFGAFLGLEKVERMVEENLEKGFIDIGSTAW